LTKIEKELKKIKKESNNRKKAKISLARIHEKLRNTRSDFLHKITRDTNSYSLPWLEDFKVYQDHSLPNTHLIAALLNL
jgi:putative transposase